METTQPDVTVTDLLMPVMEGIQLCRTLKTNPRTQAIPIAVLSAMAVQIMHDRGWTVEEAVALVKVHIAAAQEEYRQAGSPLGDTDQGFMAWLSPRHQPPTA